MKGFTLVEFLVVVSITLILMSITVSINREGRDAVLLFREQSLLVANLERAKSKSVQTFVQDPQPCGYGVHLQPNTFGADAYWVFLDIDPTADPTCGGADRVWTPGLDVILNEGTQQVFELPLNIRFSQTQTNFTDVVYSPPDPETYIDGGAESVGVIVLEASAGNVEKRIQINEMGQISVL